MLLMCDLCGIAYNKIAKLPVGFFVEMHGDKYIFIMPLDERAYRNICLKCIFANSEEMEL